MPRLARWRALKSTNRFAPTWRTAAREQRSIVTLQRHFVGILGHLNAVPPQLTAVALTAAAASAAAGVAASASGFDASAFDTSYPASKEEKT